MTDYKMTGSDLYNYRGQKMGSAKGADIYDAHGRKIGTIRDYEIYDDRYNKIASMRGDDVFDVHNVRIASINEIKRQIDNPPVQTAMVALWWFFIRK